MAGSGFKTFTAGSVLTASDVNGYLMQGVMVFASTAARDAAITSPSAGMVAFTTDTNKRWVYAGAAWLEDNTYGAWTSYTPTYTIATTATYTVTAAYVQIGKTVHFKVKILMPTVTTVGTATISISLPVTAANSDGTFMGVFSHSTGFYPILWRQTNTTTLNGTWMNGATPTTLTATSPATLGTANYWNVSGTYQAA